MNFCFLGKEKPALKAGLVRRGDVGFWFTEELSTKRPSQ